MSRKTVGSSRTVVTLFLAAGLLACLGLAGCRMQSQEIRKEVGRLDKIKAAGKLVVGTSAPYPPYEFHLLPELSNEMVGIDIDIAEAIANDLNVRLEIKDIQFSRLFDELAAGNIDIALAGLAPTTARQRVVDFSIPYYQAIQNMLVRAADKDKIRMLEDLRGKVVGTQKGSIQEDMARNLVPGATFFIHEELDALVAALKGGQVDAVIVEKPVADTFAGRDSSLLNLECNTDRMPLGSAAAVRKGDSELLERVNAVLRKLIEGNKITESIEAAKLLANKV
jgi:polar amino acid transport system substrate-binding protein